MAFRTICTEHGTWSSALARPTSRSLAVRTNCQSALPTPRDSFVPLTIRASFGCLFRSLFLRIRWADKRGRKRCFAGTRLDSRAKIVSKFFTRHRERGWLIVGRSDQRWYLLELGKGRRVRGKYVIETKLYPRVFHERSIIFKKNFRHQLNSRDSFDINCLYLVKSQSRAFIDQP